MPALHRTHRAGGTILTAAVLLVFLAGLGTPPGRALLTALGALLGWFADTIPTAASGLGFGGVAGNPLRAALIGALAAAALMLFANLRMSAVLIGVILGLVLYSPDLLQQIRSGNTGGLIPASVTTTSRTTGGADCAALRATRNRASAATAGTPANSAQRIAVLRADNALLRAGC